MCGHQLFFITQNKIIATASIEIDEIFVTILELLAVGEIFLKL